MGEGSSMEWYVIHTYSGHENKVKNNLERAIHAAGLEPHFGQILVATEEFAEMKDGKRITSKRKTFPSYVLVEMDLNQETRLVVQNVPGVTRFVGSGQEPIPLREAEVKRILGHMEAGGRLRGSAEGPVKSGEAGKGVRRPFTAFTRGGGEGDPARPEGKGIG